QSVEAEAPEITLILAGDHIYKMNYRDMVDWHRQNHADITIATIRVPRTESKRFGVAEMDADFGIVGFVEKPEPGDAVASRFDHSMVSASMGVYVFNTEVLLRALHEDAQDPNSSHDFGKDIIPANINDVRVVAYDFRDINAKQVRYWRDVG